MFSWLLGPPALTAEQQVQAWKDVLRKERVSLESNNRLFDRLEDETKAHVREYVQMGEMKSARILTGAIVDIQKARERNLIISIQIKSVETQLVQQLALAKVTRALAYSAKAMEGMNALIQIPQMNETAKELAREMHKAGLIEQVLQDVDLQETVSEAADAEIDIVLSEIAGDLRLPNAHVEKIVSKEKIIDKKALFE